MGRGKKSADEVILYDRIREFRPGDRPELERYFVGTTGRYPALQDYDIERHD